MADKFLQIQQQMRHDNEDLQAYLRDLKNWETDIKQKDEELRQTRDTQEAVLPPIRNQGKRKPKEARKKKLKPTMKQSPSADGDQNGSGSRHSRIRAYDYRSWDKFDVDKACADLDSDEDDMAPVAQDENGKDMDMETETDSEEERELERQRRIQQASMEKEKGNALFKQGKFEAAVVCYTAGMEADPTNAILPANRAMACLKLKRFEDAERDCDKSISLDCTYVKAYARRAGARFGLGKLEAARKDYQQVLNLEPSNKQAASEINRIDKTLKDRDETERQKREGVYNVIQAVEKPVHLRSKKPLKRMVIEEIGTGSGDEEDDNTQTAAPHKPQDTSPSDRVPVPNPIIQTNVGNLSEGDRMPSLEISRTNTLPSEVRIPDQTQTKPSPMDGLAPSKLASPPDIPGIPSSSFQLLADWKKLEKFPEQLFQYFKTIPPRSYKQLLQQSLDATLLMGILNLLKEQYLVHNNPVYETLKGLSQVKRFDMNVMFMSSKDKQVVWELFNYMERSGDVDRQELDRLREKYQS